MKDLLTIWAPGLIERGSLVLTPPRHGKVQTALNVHDALGYRAVVTHHPERVPCYVWEERDCALVLAIDGVPVTASVDRLKRWAIDYWAEHVSIDTHRGWLDQLRTLCAQRDPADIAGLYMLVHRLVDEYPPPPPPLRKQR